MIGDLFDGICQSPSLVQIGLVGAIWGVTGLLVVLGSKLVLLGTRAPGGLGRWRHPRIVGMVLLGLAPLGFSVGFWLAWFLSYCSKP